MKFDVNGVSRVAVTNCRMNKEMTDCIKAEHFIVGKRGDGSCYFKNSYTELPNEFGIYSQADVNRMFQKTLDTLNELISKPCDTKICHQYVTWHFKVWFTNGEFETFSFVNKEIKDRDVEFKYAVINDILKAAKSNLYYMDLMTLEDMRAEIESGYVPFDVFYDRVEKRTIGVDDQSYMYSKKHEDGSASIFLGNDYGQCNELIRIDNNGFIVKYFSQTNAIKYIQILQEKKVRIKGEGAI